MAVTKVQLDNAIVDFERRYPSEHSRAEELEEAIVAFADCFADLWDDLRPSEAQRLNELLDAAQERAGEAAYAAIVDPLYAAAEQFNREHPDAPRKREKVAA